VCGGEVPYTADLAPKNQKHPRPRAPERHEAATRSRADGGEESNHDGESSGEARGRRGGPKTRRSTTQEAHEQKQPPTTARRQLEMVTSARTGTSRRGHERGASAQENPATENYPQQKKTPKLKDPSKEEKLREPRPERNQRTPSLPHKRSKVG
jgi:hypothetical protein